MIVYSADFTHQTLQAAKSAGEKDFLVKGATGWPDLLERINHYAARDASAC